MVEIFLHNPIAVKTFLHKHLRGFSPRSHLRVYGEKTAGVWQKVAVCLQNRDIAKNQRLTETLRLTFIVVYSTFWRW